MGDGGARQSPSLDLKEHLKETSFHGSSKEEDMALDFPQESTVPFAPAPFNSVGRLPAGLLGLVLAENGRQRLGRRRLMVLRRKRKPNKALLWLHPSRSQRSMTC